LAEVELNPPAGSWLLRTLAALLGLLLVAPNPAHPQAVSLREPGLRVEAKTRFYEVRGTTAGELAAALQASGPVHEGQRFFARHDWTVSWHFRYAPREGSCELYDVVVELQSTTLLPRWRPPSRAPDTLVTRWHSFVAALARHERAHQDNGATAAREILDSLRSLRRAACANIEVEANLLAARIVRRHQALDHALDLQTRHGATEGAVWPPRR
jgi:predicted secreted Zn-dependent protease